MHIRYRPIPTIESTILLVLLCWHQLWGHLWPTFCYWLPLSFVSAVLGNHASTSSVFATVHVCSLNVASCLVTQTVMSVRLKLHCLWEGCMEDTIWPLNVVKPRLLRKLHIQRLSKVRLKHRACSLSAGVNHCWFLVSDQVNSKYLMTTTCKDTRM
jgi:hypothetical protein